MFRTETTSCRTNCPDIVVLVQGDGHTEGGEEGHLPQVHGGERGARAVCAGVRGSAGTGPNISLTCEHI